MPSDIAGMIGLPYVGDIYYVDGVNGNDSYGGTRPDNAFATLSKALAATTNYHHDVIVIVPTSIGTGEPYAITETAAIAWNKSLTHLIGDVSPSMLSQRVKVYTATAALSPFVTISGQGCIFKNVMFYSAATTNYINVRVSGNRNYFENCHFAGLMNATAAANATGSSLELYGAQENVFVNCTVGADTVTRTANNANLRFALGSDTVARNIFAGCVFPMIATADRRGLLSLQIPMVWTDGICLITASLSTALIQLPLTRLTRLRLRQGQAVRLSSIIVC